ncbi:MAG: Hpt domain-containing protein [Bacilli bacterium]
MSDLIEDLQKYGVNRKEIESRFMGDYEFYVSCIKEFLSSDGFADLLEKMDKKDYQAAFEVSHGIKGVVGNLGFTPFYDCISAFTDYLRNNDNSKAVKMLPELKKEYEVIHTLLVKDIE